MIRDYGEDVGSEETRSIESEDLRKDDVSDLFDESEEIRRPKEPGQLENPRDLSANTGSVPHEYKNVSAETTRLQPRQQTCCSKFEEEVRSKNYSQTQKYNNKFTSHHKRKENPFCSLFDILSTAKSLPRRPNLHI
jgi:hypothetical protein